MATALVGLAAPGAASAIGAHEPGFSLTPSSTRPYAACSPNPDQVGCLSIVDPSVVKTSSGYRVGSTGPLLQGGGEEGGLDPENLQSAYKIPTKGGSTETVAVIDAYGYKEAENDLAAYRKRYELSSCKAGCFKKINEKGEEAFSLKENGAEELGWTVETALDLDMVSAACPECHILLVEATEPTSADLAAAEEEAAKWEEPGTKKKVTEISNSYGTPENDTKTCPKEGCKE
ncbi:MAG TPA: hypothetical protein VNV37_10160 [Solirubrobacteraceae bacterium]|nr:hypothetical protein [Solirubrobacteraceae bacterium]